MDDLETNDHIEPSVFGEEGDDPFALPPSLASLPPPGEDIGDVQAQNGVLNLDGETGEEDKQTTKKKRAPRPRVNLNEARLCDKKGIAALKNLCGDVTFNGKGHETSDLNQLLQQFEHWAQCLMPRWPFDNVVKKCEKLGTKRSVQNELKRLRRNEDDILRGDSADEHMEEGGEGETSAAEQQADKEPEVATQETPVELTDDQMERMRKNRELAFARREALKKRRLEEEQSQNEATTEMSERTENTSKDRDNTDENDLDIVGAAETDKEMDESLTGESFQLDLSYDDDKIGETVIDQIITDTNVNKDSAEQQAEVIAETVIDQMDTDSDINVHEISAEVQPTTRIPFNDDEIEAPLNNQADIEANIEEIVAEHPTENREPVENLFDGLNDTINQIESAANNKEESLELETQTRVLTEKPILVNSGNEYAEEVDVAKHDEKTKTNNDLAVEDSGPNPETSSHSDKENEGTIVSDETDDQMDTDLEELSGVKNNDTRTTENPDMKNGITENHDMVVENADDVNTGVIA